jgi:hypothetical protein
MPILITGCVTLEGQKPDGTRFKYSRIGNQQIGGLVVYPDGSFLVEQQKSDNETLYQAINKLVDKVP